MPERVDRSSKTKSRRGTRAADRREGAAVVAVGRQDPKFSQSLERGLAILACFTVERSLLGIAEMADQLGLSRSTTHRYATTLVELGYLEQEDDRKYRLGLRVTDLGSSALSGTGLREHARPHLQKLRSETTMACGLSVLDGGEIVYLERLRPQNASSAELSAPLAPGSRLPAHTTAAGKLLLASISEEERERALKQAPGLTAKGRRELASELDQIAESGIARNDDGTSHALAVGVRENGGEVLAAVNLVATHQDGSGARTIEDYRPRLEAAAQRISAQLGR